MMLCWVIPVLENLNGKARLLSEHVKHHRYLTCIEPASVAPALYNTRKAHLLPQETNYEWRHGDRAMIKSNEEPRSKLYAS
jgi:hypothetical protein